jgi:hypothetical protein
MLSTIRNNKMKLLSHILFLIVLTSCNAQKPISFDFSKVNTIEVYQGYPGTKIKMKDGFEKEFIFDLNESKNVGPTKYIKTHRILIHHTNGKIDTLLTNGTIHQFNGWSKSQIDLLEKYSKVENTNLSDTINGQLQIAERLKVLMESKKYDDAILLFSKTQQENIKKIKEDKEIFNYWCLAWTFDDAKYQRYVTKIKEGKAYFIFEDNEWKINEK